MRGALSFSKTCTNHKCHNHHAIRQKVYPRFGKNEPWLYLNGAKISSIGAGPI